MSTETNKEKIVAFVNSKAGNGDTLKLNDFLKSLWPIVPNEPPGYTLEQNIRLLRKELRDLAESGQIRFMQDLYLRLGKAFWPDTTGRPQYYNLDNTPIEVYLPQNG